MSVIAETPAPVAVPSGSTRTWKRVALLAILAAVLAGGVAVFAVTRDDTTPSQTITSQRITATQAACEQWMTGNGAAATGPNAAWCGSMAGWMNGQMGNGHMMSGAWTSPEGMIDVCQQWSAGASAPPSGGDPTAWCQQMVSWMTEQMGGWKSSGDWDHYMGGWGSGVMGR